MFWFDFNWQIQQFLNQWWWPINILLLVILVVLGYLSYKKPAYAAGLTIVLLPTYLFRSYIWFLPFTFLELCIWITFIGWAVRAIKTNQFDVLGARYYRWPIILMLLASAVAMFVAPSLREAAGLWKAYFVQPILFFIVVSSLAQSAKNKNTILWSLGISTLSISLLAIFQKLTGFGIPEGHWVATETRRVTAMFTSPNAVGLYLGPIVALYAGWLIAGIKNVYQSGVKLIIIILALAAILFTISQGTWLGLLVAMVFLAYWGWHKKYTTILLILGLLLIILIPFLRETAWSLANFQDAAGQNRLTLLQMSQQYLTSEPSHFFLGAGIMGFAQIQNQWRDPLKIEPLLYPHNIILNFWLEIGLLGLLAFSWIIIKFFKAGFNQLKTNYLTLGLLASMVIIIVHGLVDVPYFKNDLAVLFWTIIGLLEIKN